jgi:2-methylisocitrate lyase-like PEP mutase family enzyme
MTLRKKLRQLLAARGLTVLPGAYDALSARIIARAGFDAIMAGGYAANGSLLAQADMGQSNMRDYADHYARICAAVLRRRRHRLRRSAERAPDGARL